MKDKEKLKRRLAVQAAVLLAGAAVAVLVFAVFHLVQPVKVIYWQGGAGDGESFSEEENETLPLSGRVLAEAEAEPAGAAETPLPPHSVDLNSAGEEELERLPGIGPALARRIVDFRARYGGFSALEELTEVEGVGQAKLEALREYVYLG